MAWRGAFLVLLLDARTYHIKRQKATPPPPSCPLCLVSGGGTYTGETGHYDNNDGDHDDEGERKLEKPRKRHMRASRPRDGFFAALYPTGPSPADNLGCNFTFLILFSDGHDDDNDPNDTQPRMV